MKNTVTIENNKLLDIRDTIVKSVSPEKIILFGSWAKRQNNPDSDIDLLVIWDTDMNPHKRNLFLSRLFPSRNFSLDIFAFTQKEFANLKDIPGTMIYEAIHHGKVLYG